MDDSCGFFGLTPKRLRRFASVRCFMVVYGFLGTVQAMAFVYLVVTLTTMEKRFKIPSRTTGLILTGNEISQILLSLILSYHGAHRNRPRLIACGVALSALSCFAIALPHAIFGPGEDALAVTKEYLDLEILNNVTNRATAQLCTSSARKHNCYQELVGGDFSVLPLMMVFLSQFILGIGNTLYFSLGQTYLDDNTQNTRIPVLLGWILALRTLGPVVGFVLGYMCLNVYIDPSKTPLIDKNDPRWIGAWWLGWLLLGTLMFVFSILIGMFPQRLKTDYKSNLFAEPKNTEIPKFKDFPAALRRLLNNKLLMFNNFSAVFYILGTSGYINYISKYLEVQFQETSTYTVITGPTMLVGMVAGFLISGYVITKYKPSPKYLLGWNIIVGLVYVIGQFVFMEIDCPIKDIHAVSKSSNRIHLNSSCNDDCFCSNAKYSPICEAESQITFFSPCHAGCKEVINGSKLFTDCSCLNSTIVLKDGPCLVDCSDSFLIFVLVAFIGNLMGSSGRIGNLLVNYRCVSIRDKSLAQGLTLWLISLLALIPGPIIYGAIIDSTCLIWNASCGKQGNCISYDRRKMRVSLNSTAITFGVTSDVVVWYLGRNLKLYDTEQKEEELKPIKNENK